MIEKREKKEVTCHISDTLLWENRKMRATCVAVFFLCAIGIVYGCRSLNQCCDRCTRCVVYDCTIKLCECIDARGAPPNTMITVGVQTHEIRGGNGVIELIPRDSPWDDFYVRCTGHVILVGDPSRPCGKLKILGIYYWSQIY